MVIATPMERISPASSLVLKVYACLAMVVDHADWFLLDGALGFHATWGRTVFPIFALLLGYNASRAEPSHLLRSVVPRMLLVGAIAHFPYAYLGGWSQLGNVMFTLALALWVWARWQLGGRAVPALGFVLLGALVDYQWWGVLVVIGCAWAMEQRRFPVWAFGVAWTVLLLPINGNAWAVLAAPIVAIAMVLQDTAPRFKWAFYAWYPVHLVVLAFVSRQG